MENIKYKIHLQGIFEEKNINLIYKHQDKIFTNEGLNLIENNWNLIKQNGLYDGDLVEFIGIEIDKSKLNIFYDYTKYRYILVTKLNEYNKLKNNYLSNHICISTAIITKDNKVIICKGLENNQISDWKFIGGIWEKSCNTIKDNVMKELKEEIYLQNFVSDLKITGIADFGYKTCISTTLNCSLTSEEIKNHIELNKEKIEDIREIYILNFLNYNKNSIINFMENNVFPDTSTHFTLNSLIYNIN